jgi:hypothetical protein
MNMGLRVHNQTSVIFDNTGPGPVSNYSKTRLGPTTYEIKWHTPGDSDFAQVYIYKSDNPDFSADSAHFAYAQGGVKNTDYSWTDTGIDSTKNYYYLIRALDFAGNSSSLVGDVYVIEESPSPGSQTTAPSGEKVTVLPKEGGGGSVLGEESQATPSPTSTSAPLGGLVGKTVEFAKNKTFIFIIIIIIVVVALYLIYRFVWLRNRR